MFLFFYFIIYIKWIHFIINQIIKLGKYMKIYIVRITYIIKLFINSFFNNIEKVY